MKHLNFLLAFILVYHCGFAQIKHTDINPVRVITGSTSSNMLDSVKMHPAHPLSANIGVDSALHIWHFDVTSPAAKNVGIDCRGMEIEVLQLASSLVPGQPAAIDSGIMIDAGAGTWQRPNYKRLAIQGANDNWDNQTDKYLGVRFRRAGKWYYSWVKLSIDALPTKVELKGYAYESTAEKGIVAGNKGSGSTNSISYNAVQLVSASAYNKIITFSGLKQDYNATIVDMSGRVVSKATIGVQNNAIELQHLPGGIYVVKIQSGTASGVYKVML